MSRCFICALVCIGAFVILATALAAAADLRMTYLSPCTWMGEINQNDDGEKSTSAAAGADPFDTIIRASFDKLNLAALKNASSIFAEMAEGVPMCKRQGKANVKAEATVMSVIFANEESSSTTATTGGSSGPAVSHNDMMKAKVVPAIFVDQLQRKQKTVGNCKQRVIVLTLVIRVPATIIAKEKTNKNQHSSISALSKFRLTVGPLLYGIAPAAPWIFTHNFLSASSSSPSSAALFATNGALPLHRYEGEKEHSGSASFMVAPAWALPPSSIAFHQFLLSLRDLKPLVSHLGRHPTAVVSSLSRSDVDEIFQSVPLFKSPLTAAKQSKSESGSSNVMKTSVGPDTLLVRCDTVQDIVFLRDELSPKRVVFVVSDAAVLATGNAEDASGATTPTNGKATIPASSIVAAAASEGRVLFVWHRRDADDIDAERRVLQSRRDWNEYSQPGDIQSIIRVNHSIDFYFEQAALKNNRANPLPVLLLLSDSLVDDGVVSFRGSWSIAGVSAASGDEKGKQQQQQQQQQSLLLLSGEKTAATVNPADALDDTEIQAALLQAATDETVMLPGEESENNNADNAKQKPASDAETTGDKKTKPVPTNSVATSFLRSSKMIAQGVPVDAVNFISAHANPGILEPLYDETRRSLMNRFRTFAVLSVQSAAAGFLDAAFNAETAAGILKNLLHVERRRGYRTGGLVPVKIGSPSGYYDSDSSGIETTTTTTTTAEGVFLVPLMFLNSVLHGDFLVHSVGVAHSPCFFFYDRRERRLTTDRVLWASTKGHTDAPMVTARVLDVWHRTEKFLSLPATAASHGEIQQRLGIVSEATTLSAQLVQWLERLPVIGARLEGLRLWMRLSPDDMLMCLAGIIGGWAIVLVVVFVAYLLHMPNVDGMRKIVYGTEEEKEATKEKIRQAAALRREVGKIRR